MQFFCFKFKLLSYVYHQYFPFPSQFIAYQLFSLIGPFHRSHKSQQISELQFHVHHTHAHQCIATCVSLNEQFCSFHFLNFSNRKISTQLTKILTYSLFDTNRVEEQELVGIAISNIDHMMYKESIIVYQTATELKQKQNRPYIYVHPPHMAMIIFTIR